jgi:hypothetical protein
MSNSRKLLAAMRRNPRGDFSINDIGTVCRAFEELGIKMRPPRAGGSHYTVQYPGGILTIPARKPIKPVYVKQFVGIVDGIIGTSAPEEADNG